MRQYFIHGYRQDGASDPRHVRKARITDLGCRRGSHVQGRDFQDDNDNSKSSRGLTVNQRSISKG